MSNDNENAAAPPNDDANALFTVGIKAPPFYRNNPDAWFLMLESQFALRRITAEETRFHHLVSHLPEDIASVLLSANTPLNYTELKKAITEMLQKSQQEKINDLLNVTDLGGDKPSVFVRRLSSKMAQCGLQASPDMIKATLLRCLPAELRLALSGFQDQTPEHLATIADSMLAIQSASARVNAAVNQAYNPEQHKAPPPAARQTAPFKPGQRPVICRAHLYYGPRARTCRHWCQFPRTADRPRPKMLGPNDRTPAQSRSGSPVRPASENA